MSSWTKGSLQICHSESRLPWSSQRRAEWSEAASGKTVAEASTNLGAKTMRYSWRLAKPQAESKNLQYNRILTSLEDPSTLLRYAQDDTQEMCTSFIEQGDKQKYSILPIQELRVKK